MMNRANHQRHGRQFTKPKKAAPYNLANEWDRIGLEELMRGKHSSLLNMKSNFQKIQLVEARDLRLYLNDQLQFSTLDERIYHEALVHPVFALARSRKKVLIAGGGDGLALREVLKYKDVKHVDLVDLDPAVLNAAKNNRTLAAVNEYSLHDPRVHVHAMDAVKFLADCEPGYNIIIVDFPDPNDRIISGLYTTEVYGLIKRSLSDNGLFVCQANSVDETPIVFWSIGKTIESSGFSTLSYHTIVPSFGDWGFHIGAPRSVTRPSLHSMPQGFSKMAKFSREISKYKNRGVVNTKSSPVLQDIFLHEINFLN